MSRAQLLLYSCLSTTVPLGYARHKLGGDFGDQRVPQTLPPFHRLECLPLRENILRCFWSRLVCVWCVHVCPSRGARRFGSERAAEGASSSLHEEGLPILRKRMSGKDTSLRARGDFACLLRCFHVLYLVVSRGSKAIGAGLSFQFSPAQAARAAVLCSACRMESERTNREAGICCSRCLPLLYQEEEMLQTCHRLLQSGAGRKQANASLIPCARLLRSTPPPTSARGARPAKARLLGAAAACGAAAAAARSAFLPAGALALVAAALVASKGGIIEDDASSGQAEPAASTAVAQ